MCTISAIIAKLPLSRKDYRKSLKYKKSEFFLTELESHLKIEEDECIREDSSKVDGIAGKVMIVNDLSSSQKLNKSNQTNPSGSKDNKRKRQMVECHYCHKTDYYKKECRKLFKKKEKFSIKPDEANHFMAMIFEVNMVDSDQVWWVDSGVTRYVYKISYSLLSLN
jgi:hypothetical protein